MLCETPPAHTEIEHQHARDERHRRWHGRLPPPQEAKRWRNEQQPATGSCNAGGQAGASKFFHLCRERSETHQWMETSRLTQQAIKHEGDDSGKRTQCSGNPGGQHDKEYKFNELHQGASDIACKAIQPPECRLPYKIERQPRGQQQHQTQRAGQEPPRQ